MPVISHDSRCIHGLSVNEMPLIGSETVAREVPLNFHLVAQSNGSEKGVVTGAVIVDSVIGGRKTAKWFVGVGNVGMLTDHYREIVILMPAFSRGFCKPNIMQSTFLNLKILEVE
jgi:hypothetical protein